MSPYRGDLQSPVVMGVITAAGVGVIAFVIIALIMGAVGRVVASPVRDRTYAEVRLVPVAEAASDEEFNAQAERTLELLGRRAEAVGCELVRGEVLTEETRMLTFRGIVTEPLLRRGECVLCRPAPRAAYEDLLRHPDEGCRSLLSSASVAADGGPRFSLSPAQAARLVEVLEEPNDLAPCLGGRRLLLTPNPLQAERTVYAYLLEQESLAGPDGIAEATHTRGPTGRPVVRLRLADAGATAGAGETGVAVVVDGAVYGTPAAGPGGGEDSLVFAPPLSATETRDLAAALATGPLPLDVEVLDLRYSQVD